MCACHILSVCVRERMRECVCVRVCVYVRVYDLCVCAQAHS